MRINLAGIEGAMMVEVWENAMVDSTGIPNSEDLSSIGNWSKSRSSSLQLATCLSFLMTNIIMWKGDKKGSFSGKA